MNHGQPLPRLWLMTDERIADLAAAIRALPRGAGIVFRHHATPAAVRRALFDEVRQIARARRLVLLLAATPMQARAWKADGAHDRSLLRSKGLRTVAVHNVREKILAERIGADLIFVSPVFATRTHPNRMTLGPIRVGLLVGTMRGRTLALGGMTSTRSRRLTALSLHGWAAIDGLDPERDQNRKAVPM